MAAIGKMVLTADGEDLLMRAVMGKELRLVSIVLGEGYLPIGIEPTEITEVIAPKVELSQLHVQSNEDGSITVLSHFANNDMDMGFFYRELALIADDPEKGRIVYAYCNFDMDAVWIPPTEGSQLIEKTIKIVAKVGAANNITVEVALDAYAERREVEELRVALEAHATSPEAHEDLRGDVIALGNTVVELQSEVDTLRSSVFNNMTNNVFLLNFDRLDSVNLIRGVYDPVGRKISV